MEECSSDRGDGGGGCEADGEGGGEGAWSAVDVLYKALFVCLPPSTTIAAATAFLHGKCS